MTTAFSPFTAAHAVEIIMQVFQSGADVTPAQVEEQVQQFLEAPPFSHLKVDTARIVDEILRRIKVVIGAAAVLVDDHDHVDWLEEADRSNWRLWPRLEEYLKAFEKLPPSVVSELGRSTDLVLKRLESPEREGHWDRRGLVVGHVQSGKTTHYTGLAAKALDSGYQIVIILSNDSDCPVYQLSVLNTFRDVASQRLTLILKARCRHCFVARQTVEHRGRIDVMP